MPKSLFRRLTKKFFIATNGILAVLFLLSCYAGWFNPDYWWPIGFLTLASFYLLIFLLLFILFWFFVKPRWSLISVITILLAYKPVNNIIPLRFSSTFINQKKESAIRIMSWNVEHFDILEHKTHPEKKQQMMDIIRNYQPDIACFQEMVGSNIPGAINYIPDFEQASGFNEYHYSFNPKLDFDNKHHFGIIIFSRYPVINQETIRTYPNDYNSIFQYVDVVKETDTIRVFNFHLQSLKFSPTNLKYIEKPTINDQEDLRKSRNLIGKIKVGLLKRKIQAERIQTEIEKSPYPVIVCGDLNDVPNSYAYSTIAKDLKNAFTEKGSGIGRTFSGISPTLRIDNIFVADKFEVGQFVRIRKKLSDHFPIIADVQLNK